MTSFLTYTAIFTSLQKDGEKKFEKSYRLKCDIYFQSSRFEFFLGMNNIC
jgi:hypothetical protein